MTHRTAVSLGGLLTVALIAAACGGDEATPEPAASAAPPATEAPAAEPAEAPAPDAGAASGPGTAVLTIGDDSWAFQNVFCALDAEAAGNDRVSFTASAIGDSDGTRVQLSVDIQDPDREGRYEGDGVIHSVSINDIDDFENPAIAQDAITGMVGATEWAIRIDGKNVSAEPLFDDSTTDEIETTPGTVTVVCT